MDKIARIKADWKKVEADNREILTKPYIVESLDEALELSKIIVTVVSRYKQTEQAQISMSSRDVMVILNGISDEPVSGKIQSLASEIDNAVKKYYKSE